MKKMIFLLSLFFMATHLIAQTYEDERQSSRLEQVTFYGSTATITMTNGIECLWNPQPFEQQLLNHWKVGDRLSFQLDERYNCLFLVNKDCRMRYFPEITLVPESMEAMPVIVDIKPEYSDVKIILSDGTFWISDDIDEIEEWEVGDVIMMQINDDQKVYLSNLTFLIEYRGDYWPIEVVCMED